MRASYTAGVVTTLLERELNFPKVYGISAGASHTVNYVSRDIERSRASFTDLVRDPEFGGVGSFLSGRGFFNAHHLYEGIAEDLAGTDEVMAFDFDTFLANKAEVHIEGFDWETGETVAWTKADMPTMRDMMLRVRASSTMPLFMPPTTIDGRTYMDGGMGTSWGICLDAARRDGFERFFIVRTSRGDIAKSPLALCRAPCSAPLFGTIPWLPSAPSRGHLAITLCATRLSGSSRRAWPAFSTPTRCPSTTKRRIGRSFARPTMRATRRRNARQPRGRRGLVAGRRCRKRGEQCR